VKKLKTHPARVEVLEGEIVKLRNKLAEVEVDAGDNAAWRISDIEEKVESMERSGTEFEEKVRL
jgi:hypothetical protein